MRTFRCIYVNYFNRLRVLTKISTKLQKCTFLDNLRTITQEANMETRQIIHFLHLIFPLCLFVTLVFVFENSQNSFSYDPTFGPFWSVKYLYFGAIFGQPIKIFQKVDTLKLLKIFIMFCLPRGAKKKVSSHGL